MTPIEVEELRRHVRALEDEVLRLRAGEARYRTLFDSIDEGFCIIEFFDGPHGPLSDYVHIEANAAYAHHAGIPNVVGQKLREMVPDEADGWAELYGGVLRTGKPIRFERELVATGRTLELAAFRIEPPSRRQVAVLFQDITARRLSERNQAALLELSDRLRDVADPDEIACAACEVLGTRLGVSLVAYGRVDAAGGTLSVARDWTVPGVASLAGTRRLEDCGCCLEDLERGDTVVVTDAAADPRTRERVDALRAAGAAAFVDRPLFERGRLVALLMVRSAKPRAWSASDLGLVQEVADRIRAAGERLRAEIARRASEAELRLVADAIPMLVGIVDRSLTYNFANAAYRWWFDIDPKDVIGRTIRDFAGDAGFEIRRPLIEKALAGEATRMDLDWPWSDGRPRVADLRYVPRRDAGGAVDGLYIFVQDVTAQRTGEAMLTLRAETLERERDRLWETTNDLMGTAGLDGFMKSINPAWARMLGWSDEEILGRPFGAIIDPADHAATAAAIRQLAGGETVTDFVNRVLTKGSGKRTIMWTAVPYPGIELFHVVGRDMTELRQAEELLRQSQKMEAVGQLTGGLAHDFNNMLAGIVGSLELMQSRLLQRRYGDLDRYIGAAQGAAKRAAALTHRLLAFSRRQTLDPRPTDVNRLVAEMEDLVRRTVGPNVAVEVVTAGGLWPTIIDPVQLESALLNLCINARDAMPDGGRIVIETANRWLDGRAAKERGVEAGQYVSLCVSDNGTGMPPEIVEKAFEPFFTTKPIGEGTGLGLSMIYGFAKQSGGQVRIYSEPGRGTMVCLYLPRHYGEIGSPELEASVATARARAGETVLVVDDEPTMRMLLTDVLEELGYAAIAAADSAAGLKVLQSDARIDLLVTDIGLPGGLNGRQMAEAALAKRPDLKVLFITGFAENAVLNHGHLAPGMQVLTKPFAMDTLATRMREMIGSSDRRPACSHAGPDS